MIGGEAAGVKTGANKPGLRSRLLSHRLAGYAMLLLLAVGVVQVIASVGFYAAIDRQSIREDHARRVAEFLVVSERLYRLNPAQTAAMMTTDHLDATIAPAPALTGSGSGGAVSDIARHIRVWEPSLGDRPLHLAIVRHPHGRRDLVGSIQLADGAWLNFQSHDIASGWPIALRATVMTLLITLACLLVAILALRRLTHPLRQLADAADAIAHGHAQSPPVRETGTADLRNLARSFNDMQARITGLMSEQARSFEAISHDLRTPLSRLKIASDFVSESEIAVIVASSAEEMEAMLNSLQSFLRAQHMTAQAEPVDLVALVREALSGDADATDLSAPDAALVTTYREPLLLALRPLIENARQYGDRAEIAITRAGDGKSDGWRIQIADRGPGIPAEAFERILDPFFRLDDARMRNTAGFGLGIPTAHRLLERFGGALTFANREGGGLVVTVEVPLVAAEK